MKRLSENRVMGERHPASVLKEQDVLKIRELYGTGDYSLKDLCVEFHVSLCTIHHIVSGVTWRSVTGGEPVIRPHGKPGERRWKTKMDGCSVRKLREEYRAGQSGMALAKKYGIAQSTAYAIIDNRAWKQFPGTWDAE